MMFGKQFQHGVALVLEQHFFVMSAYRTVADAELLADTGRAHPLHEKRKYFCTAWAQAQWRYPVTRLFAEHSEHFHAGMHVKNPPDVGKMPMHGGFSQRQGFGNGF